MLIVSSLLPLFTHSHQRINCHCVQPPLAPQLLCVCHSLLDWRSISYECSLRGSYVSPLLILVRRPLKYCKKSYCIHIWSQSGRRSHRQMVAVKVFIDAEQKVQTDFFLRIVYEECCILQRSICTLCFPL